MSNTRITQLQYIPDIADEDVLVLDDVSELFTFKISMGNIVSYANTAIASPLLSSIDTVDSNLNALISGDTAFTGNTAFDAIVVSNTAYSTIVSTGVQSGPTELYSFSVDYRAAELTVLITDEIASEHSISKVLLVHDNSNVYLTEYAVVYTGSSDLADISAEIVGSEVVVSSNTGSSNKSITICSINLIN